jgi:hypothetical protein
VNSIEKRKNDIISMTAVKDGIELIRFIKMPMPGSNKILQKSQADETTQGPAVSCYSVHSNAHQNTNRNSHFTTIGRSQVPDSNASIIAEERELPSGEKVFDHRTFLESNPRAKLINVTVFGFNYITAIQTKFTVPGEDEPVVFLHHGSKHENSRRNEMHKDTIILEANENIETIN